MNAHVIETTVPESGNINLVGLPFQPGTNVEVIVLERPASAIPSASEVPQRTFPYRGLPHRYDDPFAPAVPEEDWEARQPTAASPQ